MYVTETCKSVSTSNLRQSTSSSVSRKHLGSEEVPRGAASSRRAMGLNAAEKSFTGFDAPDGVFVPPPPGLEHIAPGGVHANWGTFGHPEMCFRPCIFISKEGGCPSGITCRWCHLPHGGATSKPSKRQRQLLGQMNDQDRLGKRPAQPQM